MAQVIDDRWQIEDKLGEGGQAETFVVIDLKGEIDRAVLKRLKNPNRLPRFKQEIDVIARLEHPRVVRLIASNAEADKPYLVSEYCVGGTLEGRKALILQSSVDERLTIFEQVCDGVAAAHASGIVHRDIKPANIFLRQNDQVVVGDFGVCFIQSNERLTETMEAVGARFYMAPELADGRSQDVTTRSDVYSLGKLLYWLMAGKVFDREEHRRPDRLLTKQFQDESILHVHQFLDRMIAHDPSGRLPDAGSVRDEIAELRRLLIGGYPTLEHLPQRCRYCGTGSYKLLGNSADKTAVFNFGLDPTNTVPHIFVCQHCGHVEMFRPAYSSNSDWLGYEPPY